MLPRRLGRLLSVAAATVLLAGLLPDRAAAQTAGFVYALRQVFNGTNQIYAFRVDAVTGALTSVPGFPIGSGGTGLATQSSEAMVFANGLLYVINDGNNTLSVFSASRTTGLLTAMPFSPVPLGAGDWNCVAAHPTGSPVIVGNGDTPGSVASFAVTTTAATAAPGSPFATGSARPWSCAFSRDGFYVYTGGSGGEAVRTIAGFSTSGSGVLTPLPGSPFDSGAGNPGAYATDGDGRLFTAELGTGSARVFTTVAGVPTGVTGNPFTTGLATGPRHGVLHPAGFYMVVSLGFAPGMSPPQIAVLDVVGSGAATTLAAVAGSPFNAGGLFTSTSILALTEDGGLLVAAGADGRNLMVFQVNAGTGALTLLVTQPDNTLGTTGNIRGLAIAPVQLTAFDRDGDRKADLGVFRPSAGEWWVLQSNTNFTTHVSHSWGAGTDIPVPGHYDGARRMDVAVFRPSEGIWYILRSGTGYTAFAAQPFGTNGDVPVPADYDGDGKTDIAVFRPSAGVWYYLKSGTNNTAFVAQPWGTSSDIPAPGDYDGDGRADLAVFRPSTGIWWVAFSRTNYATFAPYTWGAGTDVTVPGDYDGDGKIDPAVFRPSTGVWWVLQSASNHTNFVAYTWGAGTDVVVPANYDGDLKTDVSIFRPSTGQWWLLLSGANYTTFKSFVWGAGTDVPLPRR